MSIDVPSAWLILLVPPAFIAGGVLPLRVSVAETLESK